MDNFKSPMTDKQTMTFFSLCLFWLPTFNLKNDYSIEQRKDKFREMVLQEFKDFENENSDVVHFINYWIEHSQKLIT